MTTGACPYLDVPNTADRGAARKADAVRRADALLHLAELPPYTEVLRRLTEAYTAMHIVGAMTAPHISPEKQAEWDAAVAEDLAFIRKATP